MSDGGKGSVMRKGVGYAEGYDRIFGPKAEQPELKDGDARYLFTGDIYYTGGVTSYLPGGNHDDFVDSCRKLVDLMPLYDYLMPAHNEPLVEREQMREMYMGAKGIKDDTITEYAIRRSVAVNYDLMVRRYQFSRFSKSVRADIFEKHE